MTGMVEKAIEAVQTSEVQAMIKALHKYGLGAFDPNLTGTSPVGWVCDEHEVTVVTACFVPASHIAHIGIGRPRDRHRIGLPTSA